MFCTQAHTNHLLNRVLRHEDAAAYRELFLLYYGRLVAFARHITGEHPLAEEAVSDAFLKLWLSRGRDTEITGGALYLFTATRNSALTLLERERRYRHTDLSEAMETPAGAATDPEQLLMAREAGSRIQSLVAALPPQCRLIFRLVKEEGLRYKEVASLLSLSPKTVEAQMAIALRRIARGLEQHSGTVSLN